MPDKETSLIPKPPSSVLPSEGEWKVIKEICGAAVVSGLIGRMTKEQAIAVALKGRELGIPPMAAFSQIKVIQGNPTCTSELMLALIYRRYPNADINYEEGSDFCKVIALRPGGKPKEFTYTMNDADKAGLSSKDNWRKHPKAMLRARAISMMARAVFPDALMGLSYTPEELQPDLQVTEEGEIIDVKSSPTQKQNNLAQDKEETVQNLTDPTLSSFTSAPPEKSSSGESVEQQSRKDTSSTLPLPGPTSSQVLTIQAQNKLRSDLMNQLKRRIGDPKVDGWLAQITGKVHIREYSEADLKKVYEAIEKEKAR